MHNYHTISALRLKLIGNAGPGNKNEMLRKLLLSIEILMYCRHDDFACFCHTILRKEAGSRVVRAIPTAEPPKNCAMQGGLASGAIDRWALEASQIHCCVPLRLDWAGSFVLVFHDINKWVQNMAHILWLLRSKTRLGFEMKPSLPGDFKMIAIFFRGFLSKFRICSAHLEVEVFLICLLASPIFFTYSMIQHDLILQLLELR